MQTPQELFVHELQDVYAAELALAEALDRMSREWTTQEVRQAFRTHRAETQTHVNRLQEVFGTIGQQPADVRCEGIDGIVAEHESFVGRRQPTAEMHALFDVGVGQRAEHYEVAAYEELVRIANVLGLNRVAQLLEANLADERQQLERLTDIAGSFAQSQAAQRAREQVQGGQERGAWGLGRPSRQGQPSRGGRAQSSEEGES
ncbi:YciE/YciF ferroxidase family protein [Halomicrobium urmianum]|uniref:YciE/YciF ferroxidase family protein n=1 Tax=Halomicrobium urmianum TaxID=1586233 RepID=UPI001CDA2630|nr:DUF892 family protein [Halomicrobium urmianum]